MKKSSMDKKAPFSSSKKFEYSITYSSWDEESLEMGETDDKGYEVEPEVENISEILYKSFDKYGIYYPVSIGTWESTEPKEDTDFYEKGIRKYYVLHLRNEDGTEISEEDNDFITHLLSNGEYNREYFEEYAFGGLLGDKRWNRSWHFDHDRYNKSESYEIPMSKRKKARGGDVQAERDWLDNRISNLKNLLSVINDEDAPELQSQISRLEKERDSLGSYADGGGVEGHKHVLHIDGQNWFLEKIDSTHFYMSNDPNYRGMAHHIGQHKGEPYYEEVREWLKTTYAKGGTISIYELKKGDKVRTRKGNIETVQKKVESGYFTQESEYSHPFESLEFVERPKKYAKGGSVGSDKSVLQKTIVYDNNGDTFDRYTVFTPDGSVYGMSDNPTSPQGFNQYLGDDTEVEKGEHLGRKLKSVPKSIEKAVLNRMEDDYANGGSVADVSSVRELYEDEVASEYPYARDMVAYFIFGDRQDNKIADAINGRYSNETADESALSEIMLQYEYSWRDNMQDIEEQTMNELGDLTDYYKHGGGVRDISWDVTIRDEYDMETFELNVRGYFENEEDAIKQAIRENDIYVDESNYGQMYYNGNKISIYGAKRNYAKGGGVGVKPVTYYVAYSSYFDSNKYDIEKMTKALESIGATDIHTENDRGWSNQPEVVVFKYAGDGTDYEPTKAIQKAFDTDWIIVRVKDWKSKKMKDGGSMYDEGGEAGEMEDWMNDAIKDLRSYTDNNDLKIENVYDDDYFLASDGSHEYLVFEDFDEAHEYAVDDVKNNLEENPEYFQRDWLMAHLDAGNFFRNVYDEWNMGYATDIMTEDDDKYPNRLIAEMVEWGIMDSDEANGRDAEEIANDRMSDYVNALTDDQINQGNDGFDYYIDNFGEEEAFNMAVKNNLIDIESASEDAVNVDGVAHFISSYDGEEIALNNGSYAYRIN
jgi:hypothetical protein